MAYFSFLKKRTKPKNIIDEKKRIKAGLALGSGGARGFAHLGVLKAFEDEGITFDYIAGTSAGSIVGSLYALGYTVEQMIDFASSLSIRDIKPNKLLFMPSSAKSLENVIKNFIGDLDFSDLKKPFSCVTVDLISGNEFDIREGDLAKAVSASCAVPPFFRPVIWDEKHLIDGGFANPIPASLVRNMGAEVVISVEVNSTRGMGTDSLSMIDVFRAATRIAMRSTADQGIVNSDIMIRPDLKEYKASNASGASEMIRIGYDACYEQMNEIKRLLLIENSSMTPKGAPEFKFNS